MSARWQRKRRRDEQEVREEEEASLLQSIEVSAPHGPGDKKRVSRMHTLYSMAIL